MYGLTASLVHGKRSAKRQSDRNRVHYYRAHTRARYHNRSVTDLRNFGIPKEFLADYLVYDKAHKFGTWRTRCRRNLGFADKAFYRPYRLSGPIGKLP